MTRDCLDTCVLIDSIESSQLSKNQGKIRAQLVRFWIFSAIFWAKSKIFTLIWKEVDSLSPPRDHEELFAMLGPWLWSCPTNCHDFRPAVGGVADMSTENPMIGNLPGVDP